ncbi:unannotated protein [freshwater metagenome]|uniref:Unannotated protein n=1 Tax=freshwater metagenome TaxID=449393 RepID=A0A6J6S9C9_9ZZZZ
MHEDRGRVAFEQVGDQGRDVVGDERLQVERVHGGGQ